MTAAEKHIRQYNSFNGKVVTKDQLVKVHSALKNDIASKRIDAHAPLGIECIEIEKRMSSVIGKINGKPVKVKVDKIDVDKILRTQLAAASKQKKPVSKLPALKKPVVKKVAPVKSMGKLDGVVTADQIKNRSFRKIDLDGDYKDIFVELNEDSQLMIWGMPSSGKTVWQLKFAQYLAEKKGLKVLYVAKEEIDRSTLNKKLREFNIGHPNLMFTRDLQQLQSAGYKLTDFDVVFFDSINALRIKLEDYVSLVEQNYGRIFIPIVQCNKDGSFKGGQEWEHEVDIAGEIRNRKLILRKNRMDGDFGIKRDKLLLEDKVREKEKSMQIKETVKARIAPPAEQQVISFRPDTIV
jgi:hypothetical protein